jgi:hypothetical protein
VVNLMSTTVGRCNPRVQRIARTRHSEELIYWRKWQAPSLTIMKPSRYRAYEKDKEWERNDAETSARWLANFADDYVVRLESRVKKLPGAKGPRYRHKSVRREARKLDAQTKYRSWRREYLRLLKMHEGKSESIQL